MEAIKFNQMEVSQLSDSTLQKFVNLGPPDCFNDTDPEYRGELDACICRGFNNVKSALNNDKLGDIFLKHFIITLTNNTNIMDHIFCVYNLQTDIFSNDILYVDMFLRAVQDYNPAALLYFSCERGVKFVTMVLKLKETMFVNKELVTLLTTYVPYLPCVDALPSKYVMGLLGWKQFT